MAKPSFDSAEAAEQILRDGYAWGARGEALDITFAFRSSAGSNVNPDTFTKFNSQQIHIALQALQSWSDVADITLHRVGTGDSGKAAYSNKASILLGDVDVPGAAYSAFTTPPGGGLSFGNRAFTSPDGDVYVNVEAAQDYNVHPVLWGYGDTTLVHELGHSFGLQHPGDYNAGQGEITYANSAEYRQDTRQYSIMSYFSETYTGADFHKNGVENYAASPMMHDIAAAQLLYGANMSALTGDTVFGFHSNADRPWYEAHRDADPIIFCAWDAGGNDTFDFSRFHNDQQIDLRNEHFSNVGGMISNVSISAAVLDDHGHVVNIIENAIGGRGADTITGNNAANHLAGGAGADTLFGSNGNDVLVGGKGADTLDGGKGRNVYEFDSYQDSRGAYVDTIVQLMARDRIDLSAIDADTHTAGDQGCHYATHFTRHAGELVRSYDADTDITTFAMDINGDGRPDAKIFVDGDYHGFHGFVL
jgi:serralysin